LTGWAKGMSDQKSLIKTTTVNLIYDFVSGELSTKLYSGKTNVNIVLTECLLMESKKVWNQDKMKEVLWKIPLNFNQMFYTTSESTMGVIATIRTKYYNSKSSEERIQMLEKLKENQL
jgi:hypothetical protein